jgi:APA family basic amino acid/polyamine antiporter
MSITESSPPSTPTVPLTMPAVLAGAGTMGIAVLAVVAVGAMLLAVLFGQLSKRVPNSDGGL